MGLSVVVGIFAELAEVEPDDMEWCRENFAAINEVLAENGLSLHHEPESLPPLNNRSSLIGWPYSYIHYLRRIAAYVAEDPDWKARPFPEDQDPTEDLLVSKHCIGYNHLICHSDCDGYYLPIDFDEVLDDYASGEPGSVIGSSYRLREELIAVAPALGIVLSDDGELSDEEAARLDSISETDSPFIQELVIWLALYEAARLSIQYKTAVCFS
jgi:hypothetical protein